LAQFLPSARALEENNSLQPVQWPDWLAPVLQTALVLAILFAIGAWIARAVNRRMMRYEKETFIREPMAGEAEGARAEWRQKKAARRRWNTHAENIRRIYAALVARAADAGVPRAIAETPNEFLPRLERAWMERAAELQLITRAYVAVHYGEENIPPEMLGRVRTAWQRAEKTIRARKAQPTADR
jgi:hypothetical protein